MNNGSEERLLESEGGMFLLELPNALAEAEEYISASTVEEELKSKCRENIQQLSTRAELYKEEKDYLYDLGRTQVTELFNILDTKNPEQLSLFEALRDTVWKPIYSVLGWKYPPSSL